VDEKELNYAQRLSSDLKAEKFIVASLEKQSRIADSIEIYNWDHVLKMLFPSI
jgi:hypothetical protein